MLPSNKGRGSVEAAWRTLVRAGDRLCTECQPRGDCKFGVSVLEYDDAAQHMRCPIVCTPTYEGGPGVAHGGWVCAALDEVLGQGVIEHHGRVVTANLNVDFHLPVPVGEPLTGRAWIESVDGRKVRAGGELRLTASDATLASARGLFIIIDPAHFTRHADWLDQQKSIGAGS